MLCELLRRRSAAPGKCGVSKPATILARLGDFHFALLAAGIAFALYLPALGINMLFHDWTHRHISASLASLAAMARLFVVPQADGMYRPLGFLSLWFDYRIFGPHLWGYHLQSIALHALNAALAGVLAAHLGFRRSQVRLAVLIFALAPVHFEAVIWPAARFDLLAATFALLSLILFLKHWHDAGVVTRWGVLSILCLIAAVLCKESAYSVGLLVPALILTGGIWNRKPLGQRKAAIFIGATAVTLGALIAIRFLVYNGIGGYSDMHGQSIHTTLSVRSIYSLAVNSIALPVFGINATVPGAVWPGVMLVCFCVIAVLIAGRRIEGKSKRQWTLLLLALLSAIPAANVIGWIQPSLLHSRQVYWPSLWIAFFLASILDRRSSRALIVLFLLVEASAASYNVWVYRDAMNRADRIASRIQQDVGAMGGGAVEVRVLGVPNNPNGVFLFREELNERIARAVPQAMVRVCERPSGCAADAGTRSAVYEWDVTSQAGVSGPRLQ